MESKKRVIYIILMVLIGCLLMAWVDGVVSPHYGVKSIIKLSLFLILPFLYTGFDRETSFVKLFTPDKPSIIHSIILGMGVYVIILGAYLILGPYFDLSGITKSLQENIGVNRSNFVFVAIYISFINSLLEEFFFRGFAFLTLKELTSRRTAHIFSAGAFSTYHIAIVSGWFQPLLFILLILSLFLAGLLFNWLNEKNGNIYASWLVHMCANFAINTIGFILFGIL